MDILSDFSLEFTIWLQENIPQFESAALILSRIGGFEFYLMVITLVYWCLDKRLGRTLAYVLTFSNTINSIIKHLFRDTRPYWLNSAIGLSSEDRYGVPSGHSQGVTIFWGVIALWARKTWVWILAVLFILIMALSRVYLGVHDVEDVLAGILIGVVILIGFALWQRYLAPKFANRILGQRLLVAILVPLILAGIYIGGLLLVGPANTNFAWADKIELAEQKSFEEFSTSIGGLLGLGIGFVLEVSRIRFKIAGSFWRRLGRYLVGMVGTLIIWGGLDYIFPEEPLALAVPFRIIRYFLTAFWVAYYAPWVFVKLRLATASPEPEVSITL